MSGYEEGHTLVIVLIRITHGRPVQQQGVVEQRAVAVRGMAARRSLPDRGVRSGERARSIDSLFALLQPFRSPRHTMRLLAEHRDRALHGTILQQLSLDLDRRR